LKPVNPTWLDRVALAVSPSWGVGRLTNRAKVQAWTDAGYVTPASRKKSMKGVTATANSPDKDINDKLEGLRALSRDAFMNAPLAASIIRRHRSEIVGSGLQLQARVDREVVGPTDEQAEYSGILF